MASVRPARVSWLQRLKTGVGRWVFWTEDSGSAETPVFDGETLIVSTKAASEVGHPPPPREERYRFAFKLSDFDAPAWTSEGPIEGVGGTLLIVLDNSGGALNSTLYVSKITAAWDESSSAATLRALTVSTNRETTGILKGEGTPQALFIADIESSADNGFMVKIFGVTSAADRGFRFSTLPTPVLLRHYQYTADEDTRSDATERAVIDPKALAILEDRKDYRRFLVSVQILLSEMDPLSDDETLTITDGLPITIDRMLSWPESWISEAPSAGGLPVSLVSDAGKFEDARDAVVETIFSVEDASGETFQVLKQVQVIGDVVLGSDGRGEIELRSPLDSVLSSAVVSYHPASASVVAYDAETALAILVDVFLNSGKWLYKRVHYNDIASLHARFCGVFGVLTYTAGDLDGLTVEDIFNSLGAAFGLVVSQSQDGCIDIWHPGVYRPSRSVHYFDERDCGENESCTVTYSGRVGLFSGVSVSLDGGTPRVQYPVEVYDTREGWKENLFEVDVPAALFETNSTVFGPYGIGRQLGQRFANRKYDTKLVLGLRGLPVDNGDTLVLTADAFDRVPTPCLITGVSAGLDGASVVINAVHYPEALGLHSIWTDDGVRGIWRWRTSDGGYTLDNQAHGTAPDGAFTAYFYDPSYLPLRGHWQGSCGFFGASTTDPMLDATAGVSDLFDVCTIIDGEIQTPSSPVAWSMGDATIGILMAWEYQTRYLLLFFDVPAGGTGGEKALENRLAIGVTERIDRNPLVFSWVRYLPYGAIGKSPQGDAASTIIPVSIGLEWKDSTIRVYVDRRLLLEETSATYLDKTDWASSDAFYLHPIGSGSKIGCFRHLRQTGWITERQRLQGFNGLDPYYGPDSL